MLLRLSLPREISHSRGQRQRGHVKGISFFLQAYFQRVRQKRCMCWSHSEHSDASRMMTPRQMAHSSPGRGLRCTTFLGRGMQHPIRNIAPGLNIRHAYGRRTQEMPHKRGAFGRRVQSVHLHCHDEHRHAPPLGRRAHDQGKVPVARLPDAEINVRGTPLCAHPGPIHF